MKGIEIALQGFGRIGRVFLKHIFDKYENVNISCIFDPFISIDNAIYLLRYDSTYGQFKNRIAKDNNYIIIENNCKKWRILYAKSLDELFSYKYIVNATNQKQNDEREWAFNNHNIIFYTKWLKNPDAILLENRRIVFNNPPSIYSCGICDTTGIVPFLSLFNEKEVKQINITTLHPFLSYQNVNDGPPRDVIHNNSPYYQIGRSSLGTIIPKKSSVPEILKCIFPEYENRLSFMTYRVPTDVVTTCDINILLNDNVSKKRVEDLFNSINQLSTFSDPLISKDFVYSDKNYEIDANWSEINGRNLHFTIWYNNELGYISVVSQLIINEIKTMIEKHYS